MKNFFRDYNGAILKCYFLCWKCFFLFLWFFLTEKVWRFSCTRSVYHEV